MIVTNKLAFRSPKSAMHGMATRYAPLIVRQPGCGSQGKFHTSLDEKIIISFVCVVLLCSCGATKCISISQKDKHAIKIAKMFLEKDSLVFYLKYCSNQTPSVENRYIEDGKCERLEIQIVTYNYQANAKTENSMFVNYAVKVYINGKTGLVISKLLGPDGIGKIYDRELFQNFSKNILQLVK